MLCTGIHAPSSRSVCETFGIMTLAQGEAAGTQNCRVENSGAYVPGAVAQVMCSNRSLTYPDVH